MKFPVLDRIMSEQNLQIRYKTKPVWTGGLTTAVTMTIVHDGWNEIASTEYNVNRRPGGAHERETGYGTRLTTARADSCKAGALDALERALIARYMTRMVNNAHYNIVNEDGAVVGGIVNPTDEDWADAESRGLALVAYE